MNLIVTSKMKAGPV